MASKSVSTKTRRKALKANRGQAISHSPETIIEQEPSDSSDDDSENGGVDEEGMERLMKALGDNGLDEFDQEILGSLQNGYSDDRGSSRSRGTSFSGDASNAQSSEFEDGVEGSDNGKAQSLDGGNGLEEGEEGEEEDGTREDVPLEDLDTDSDAPPKPKEEINNKIALKRIRDSIKLDPSLPWTETLTITYPATMDVDFNDDLKREIAFYKQALHAATTAKDLAAKHSLPFTRPPDYFAEMVKSDAHMERIRQRLLDESAGIKKSEEKKKEREGKKFGKKVQIEKLKERERGRKETDEKIKGLKRKRKDVDDEDADGDFDVALEDAIGDRPSKRPATPSRGGRGGKTSLDRRGRDAKFGFGGSKKRDKQNTRESTEAFVSNRGSGMRGGRGRVAGRETKRLGKSRRMAGRNK